MTDPDHPIHRLYADRFQHLESRMDNLEERIRQELEDFETRNTAKLDEERGAINSITRNVQRILDQQAANQPALANIQKIINTGIVLRWIIISVVGTLAAISTIATGWETFKGWLK